MADVVVRSTQPALGAIKLAWWRERLEELDQGMVPAEPRLQAAAAELLSRGISGGDLAQLEEGWAGLLHDTPGMALLNEHGAKLFDIGSRLLKTEFDRAIGNAGRLFACVDAGRRGLIDLTECDAHAFRGKVARRARPVTALATLAARDLKRGGPPFEPEGTPGRALALLRHRFDGRLPR